MAQRISYLDALRAFFILSIIFHHCFFPYGTVLSRSWFVEESAFNQDVFFDILILLTDVYMVPGALFVAGIFSYHSLSKYGEKKFIISRALRLLVPLGVLTPLLLPPLMYPKYVERLSLYPGFYGEAMGYLDYHFSSVYWERLSSAGTYWFLPYLMILSLLYVLIWAVFPKALERLASYTKALIQDLKPKQVGLLILILAFGVWVGDFLTGFRAWTGTLIVLSFVPSQLTTNVALFFLGAGIAQSGLLRDSAVIEALSRHKGKIYLTMMLSAILYLAYTLGGDKDIVRNQDFVFYRQGGGSFWRIWPYLWDHFIGVFPRCLLFVTVMLSWIMGLMLLFKGRFQTLSLLWQRLSENTMALFLFHLPVVIFVQSYFKGSDIPSIIKGGVCFAIALPATLVLSILVRRIPGVARVI